MQYLSLRASHSNSGNFLESTLKSRVQGAETSKQKQQVSVQQQVLGSNFGKRLIGTQPFYWQQ